jgi:ornithine cyclodeaminase
VSAGLTVVTGAEVSAVIEADRETCLDLVRRAYEAHAAGDSVNPHSSFLRTGREGARIIALPAYLGGAFDLAGLKWIASFPDNVGHGIPRASAVLVLNDTGTGRPYALLEASIVSASRTAASAVLAAESLLGGRRAHRVGIVGTGLIAGHVHAFLCDLGWDVGGWRLFDLRRAAAERFAERLSGDVLVADAPGGAFTGCDLVVIATVAGLPHLHDPALLAGAPAVLHLSLRDLAPELVVGAQNLTDDIDHVLREQTSLHLAEQRYGTRDFVDGTLVDLLASRVRRDPARAAVFSPFGLGVLDLAVAGWVHERVTASGGGQAVPDFFPG